MRRNAHWNVIVGLSLLAFLLGLWLIRAGPGFIEADEICHYLEARYGPRHPFLYASIWARPLFMAVYTLPAQLPYAGARVFALLVSISVAVLAAVLAARKGIAWPWAAFVLTAAQPYFVRQSTTVMTENLLAVLLLLSVLAWDARRRALACFLMSLTPLARPEGFFLIPIVGILVLASSRSATRIRTVGHLALLGTGGVAWLLTSWLACGDPLWLANNMPEPWSHAGPTADHAGIFAFPARLPEFASPPILLLAAAGLFTVSRRRMWIIAFLSLFFLLLHTVLFSRGYFGSTGYLRYLLPSSPFIGILAAAGLEALRDATRALRRRATAIGAAAMTLCVIYVAWLKAYPVIRLPELPPEAAVLSSIDEYLTPMTESTAFVYASDLTYYLIVRRDPWDVGMPNEEFLRYIRNDRLQLAEILQVFPKGTYVIHDEYWMGRFMGVKIEELKEMGYVPVAGAPTGRGITLLVRSAK